LTFDNVEPIAHKNFYVGVLGLFVELKFQSYENKKAEKELVLKEFIKCKKHIELLKQYSPLVSYYVVFFSTLFEFTDLSKEEISDSTLLELFNAFQEFLVYRKFNKQY
jgi:hypothetical protein